MSKKKGKEAPVERLEDKDNPSLIKAGEEIRLRVFDDFFIENSLPKWRDFDKRWDALKTRLKTRYLEDSDVKEALKKLDDPEEVKKIEDEYAQLKKMKDQLKDDSYDIKGKHERSVKESILKTARLLISEKPTFMQRMAEKLGLKKKEKLVPIEIAFADLKSHILMTSTEQMTDVYAGLMAIEKRLRETGQYAKADRLKLHFTELAAQKVLVDAGFTSYIDEAVLIDFVRKSERGVRIDFMRYYEGDIPDDVLEKKRRADETKVFDNYVIAFYDDKISNNPTEVVAKIEGERKKKAADSAVAARRDPILFGIVKGVRRLFFIADWVTPEDDLTLKKIEDVLGIRSPVMTATSGVLAPHELTEAAVRDLERRAGEARRYIRFAENYWEQSRYDTTFNNIGYDDRVIVNSY